MIRLTVRALVTGASAVCLVVLGVGPAQAARPDPAPVTQVGNDISWPQCGKTLPTGQAFGVVGVNNGLANTTNPCLAEQLAWAQTSTETTNQPRAALYVNTANPGLIGSWWPTSNFYPDGSPVPVPNPYGNCIGGNDAACAFIYGYAKAYDDAHIRGVPHPERFFWWLDVETMNTWQPDTAANRAVLEGMTYYFEDVLGAAGVGVYSTGYQWSLIVGGVGPVTSPTLIPSSSTLNGLPSWIAGATTLRGAQANCSAPPLTGGKVTVTQYVSNNLDYDWACP
ncbi:MAG TPA: hypothetical protein VN257_01320 [Actinotalea sp.]|nr:hypothetical protein [Actinotalea sp.]